MISHVNKLNSVIKSLFLCHSLCQFLLQFSANFQSSDTSYFTVDFTARLNHILNIMHILCEISGEYITLLNLHMYCAMYIVIDDVNLILMDQ